MAEQTIDKLQIELEARAGTSVRNINNLAKSLENLKNVTSSGTQGLSKFAASMDKLKTVAEGLKGKSSILTSMSKSLNALSAVKFPATDELKNFAESFEGFGGAVEEMREFRSGVGSLKTAFNNLDKINFDGMSDRIKRLVDAIKPLTDEMIRGGQGVSNFGTQMQALVSAAKATNAIQTKAGGNKISYKSHKANASSWGLEKLKLAFNFAKKAANVIGGFVGEINDYIEDLNLFTVAMGDYAEQGTAYANKMQSALGVNAGEAMRYMGVFQQMGTSMGFTQERAYTLSQTLTQLGYDWSSYYNLDTEESFTKLQSAIAGETEPVRRLGIDISSARLQQELYNLGIHKSVEELSQADKATLRYIALLKQSQNAMGDLSRSIDSPSNALRMLNAQWEVAKREIGSVFIPMLIKILPPAIAVVRILGDIARSIANLFGFELPKIDYSGVGNLSTGLSDAAGSAEDLTGNLKETKKEISGLLGFDEINALSETESSSGGGGGASSGYNASSVLGDIELPTYDMFSEIENSVDEWVGKLETPLKWILSIAGLIGAAFLGWKIKENFPKVLEVVKGLIKPILTGVTGVKGGWYALSKIVGKFKIGDLIMSIGVGSNSSIIAGLAGVLGSVTLIAGGLYSVYKNSEDFRTGLSAIWDGLKWIFGEIKNIFNFIGPIGEKIGEWDKKLYEVTDGILGLKDGFFSLGDVAILIGSIALFGPWGLAIEAIVLLVKAMGRSINDSLKGSVYDVEIFSDEISETTKSKLEPFLDQIDKLDQTMKTLKWSGKIIDQSVVDDVKKQVSEISNAIITELDSDKNEALKKLSPLKDALSTEKYNEILQANAQHYDTMKQQVTNGQNEINAIMQRASDEKRALTQAEYDEISLIQQQMRDTGVKYMSESQTEMNLIQQQLKDKSVQLSAEQAAEIVQNSIAARDATIADAQAQYDAITLEAQRMFDIGAINKDTYDEMIRAAEKTRDDTVLAAQEQHNSILEEAQLQSGDLINQVDWETGELKSKYEIWWDDLKLQWKQGAEDCSAEFSEGMNQIKTDFSEWWEGVKTWFNENVAPKFTKQYWKDKFDALVTGAQEKLDELKRKFTDWKATLKTPHMNWDMDGLKTTGVVQRVLETLNLPTSLPKLSVDWYAKGGIFDSPRIIGVGESGPEAVVPLSENAEWIESLASKIAQRGAQLANFAIPERYDNTGGGDWTFILQRADGTTEGEVTITAVDRMNQSHGEMKIPLYV